MIRINLIPREARPDRTVYYQLLIGLILVSLTVIICVYWTLALGKQVKDLKADIEDKKATLKKLEYVTKKVDEFKAIKALLIKKKETIQTLQKMQKGPVLMLMELNRARPQQQIWVTDFNMIEATQATTPAVIKLRGVGISYSSIGDFMTDLEKSLIFENVKLEQSQKEQLGPRQVYKFGLNFNMVLEEPAAEGTKGTQPSQAATQ